MAPRRARSAQVLAAHRERRAPQKAHSTEILHDAEERSQARLERSRRLRAATPVPVPGTVEAQGFQRRPY